MNFGDGDRIGRDREFDGENIGYVIVREWSWRYFGIGLKNWFMKRDRVVGGRGFWCFSILIFEVR